MEFDRESFARGLDCLQGARVRWSRRIPENADPSHLWDSLGHHLQSLGGELGKQHRHSCDVPTRLRKTCDVPEADGIGMDSEYDWNRGGSPCVRLQRKSRMAR